MIQYISWHYGKACSNWYKIYSNVLWFVPNFFSIRNLFITIFDPWGGPIIWLTTALLKIVFILFGLLVWLLLAVLGPILFIVWLILPILEVIVIPGSIISILFF